MIEKPYLLFLGDVPDQLSAKTAQGIVDWRRELCAGQLRFGGNPLDLGLPDMTPAMAAEAGVGSLAVLPLENLKDRDDPERLGRSPSRHQLRYHTRHHRPRRPDHLRPGGDVAP